MRLGGCARFRGFPFTLFHRMISIAMSSENDPDGKPAILKDVMETICKRSRRSDRRKLRSYELNS